MKKLSYKVSLGGVTAAIAMLTMFLTGLVPFSTYICPMAAGLLLIMIVIEISSKWALATYAAIALLSIFLTPDKEAAVLFIFLLGYYPIAKLSIEKIRLKGIQLLIKFVIFNIAVVVSYLLIINVFGITDFIEQSGDWGKYGIIIFIAAANLIFFLYDYSISSCITAYIKWFRPKFLRKLK